jgi:hypothetical protein
MPPLRRYVTRSWGSSRTCSSQRQRRLSGGSNSGRAPDCFKPRAGCQPWAPALGTSSLHPHSPTPCAYLACATTAAWLYMGSLSSARGTAAE